LIGTLAGDAPTVVLTRLQRAVEEIRQARHADALQRFPDDYVPGSDVRR
jgi:hypothetical protein